MTDAPAHFADRLQMAERQRAARALLTRPLMTPYGEDAEAFALARKHEAWLREWFARNAGWSLHADSEVVRLRKTASNGDATRPARDGSTQQPFTRRRYALFCLALGSLERSERQITLGRLADAIAALIATEPRLALLDFKLDISSQDHRRDLVQAIRLLLHWRILVRVQGDESQFITTDRADVLYNVDRAALSAVFSLRRGPSTVQDRAFEDRLDAISAEPFPESDEARNRRLRNRLTRRLLDDPVLLVSELAQDEREYFTSQRPALIKQVAEATGLVPEIRAEGVVMADETGDATDLGMPEEGTEGHVTLLVAMFLADRLRAGNIPVSEAAVRHHVASAQTEFGKHWRQDARQPGAERHLAELALGRLAALGLCRRSEDGVHPQPIMARYRLVPQDKAAPAARRAR
ncbi:MAG: TIGR02678 family protein [Candidatus Sericytochromatia bacterium]|nr:TIGR02678 family protein [Candidatus Tanganyikabacteria bacterium]